MSDVDFVDLKKHWISFNEALIIKNNLDDFEKYWVSYDLEESFNRINNSVLHKYSTKNV